MLNFFFFSSFLVGLFEETTPRIDKAPGAIPRPLIPRIEAVRDG